MIIMLTSAISNYLNTKGGYSGSYSGCNNSSTEAILTHKKNKISISCC